MRRAAGWLVALVASSSFEAVAKEPAPPLPLEHRHPSGAFTFRTPEGWEVTRGQRPGSLEVRAAGAAAGARIVFLYEARDLGYDSLHVSCMEARLLGPMETERVTYEYDFLSADLGRRRLLDSALHVRYDQEVDGAREWRQRNVTLSGTQEALCVIAHVPLRLWKKSARTRAAVDAVVQSLAFPGDAAASPAPAPPP